MFKSKIVNFLILFMAFAIIVAMGVFYYLNNKEAAAAKPPAINDIVDHLSVETEEMTTNLKDDKFIRIKFMMQVSSKKAKEELENRQFQVKNTILYLLANMTEKDLNGQEGLKKLESELETKLNALMESGKIVHVYTTEKIIQ
ncbi:flagellar basal body-associated FliL family protein [Tuberibacillus calidus]|uniref:flagellar basal body-associated FliL family protein n=1 Tax=Tuberibacillus calidus TaxID=340097 RepID=UPI00040DDC60|nr:flagellar basal body-associated FliL family protein [Tuberibacillus calidus]